MMQTTLKLVVFAGCLLALAACGTRQARPAQLGPDALYQQGIAAFEAGKHQRAIELLNIFVDQHLGDPRVPQAMFTTARAHQARDEQLPAILLYERIYTSFPNSAVAREARFGVCGAYAELSPKAVLDQEYTRAAIGHCEAFAAAFPGTPEGSRAAEIVTAMREKLARKTLQNGEFYLKRRAYDAAIIYFNQVVERYPQTDAAPTALERLVETYTRLGYAEEAAEAKERLQRLYPRAAQARRDSE